MTTELYRVSTTFFGADSPSRFFFDSLDKAEKFWASKPNGEIEKVFITSKEPLNYFDGCVLNELTRGNLVLMHTEIKED